jgi:hypothetical protein
MQHVMRMKLAVSVSVLVVGMALVPCAIAQSPPLDTAQVVGSAPGFPNIGVDAQNVSAGGNATGDVFLQPSVGAIMTGRVSCLRVTGPDRGVGTPDAPTTAVVEFSDIRFGEVTVEVVDNGGTATNSDTDLFASAIGPGCLSPNPNLPPLVPLHGYVAVFDAPPPAPTSKDQCKNEGWRDFGSTFKNQGDCVSYLATHGRNQPSGH